MNSSIPSAQKRNANIQFPIHDNDDQLINLIDHNEEMFGHVNEMHVC